MLSLRTWDTPTAEPAVNRQGVGGSDLKLLLSGEDLSGLHLWAPGDTVGHLSVWVELSAPRKAGCFIPAFPSSLAVPVENLALCSPFPAALELQHMLNICGFAALGLKVQQ